MSKFTIEKVVIILELGDTTCVKDHGLHSQKY